MRGDLHSPNRSSMSRLLFAEWDSTQLSLELCTQAAYQLFLNTGLEPVTFTISRRHLDLAYPATVATDATGSSKSHARRRKPKAR